MTGSQKSPVKNLDIREPPRRSGLREKSGLQKSSVKKSKQKFTVLTGDDGRPGSAVKKRVGQPGRARNSRLVVLLDKCPPPEKKPRMEPANKTPKSAAVVVDLTDDKIVEEIGLIDNDEPIDLRITPVNLSIASVDLSIVPLDLSTTR